MKFVKHNKLSLPKNYTQLITAAIVIAAITILGVHVLTSSHAQSPYVAANAVSGTLGGSATVQSGSNASGGQYVQFGTVINPAPTGPTVPSSGWHVAFADDFNAPLGTSTGQDNLIYPYPYENNNPTSNSNGYNGYETEVYNASQVTTSNGNLVLTSKYQNDVAPATGDGSGSSTANFVQRNYVSGIITTPTNIPGYKGFTWTPGDGSTWAFEIDCQWPVNTGELFNGSDTSAIGPDVNERDFFEGKAAPNSIDTDWIYETSHSNNNTGVKKQDYYNTTLSFDPSAAMHRYTYVVYPNQSWSFYIDGVLQTWVGTDGVAPPEMSTTVPLEMDIGYALSATTFTTGTRQFLIHSLAVYQDNAHAGSGDTVGGGIAPGTTIGD